jgi:hypothetical protein
MRFPIGIIVLGTRIRGKRGPLAILLNLKIPVPNACENSKAVFLPGFWSLIHNFLALAEYAGVRIGHPFLGSGHPVIKDNLGVRKIVIYF